MNIIEQNFINSGKVMNRNGIILMSKNHALDFIKQCEQNSIVILGIDSFYLDGDKIQPSLENSIDFSSKGFEQASDTYSYSLSFIRNKSGEFFFEVVCQ